MNLLTNSNARIFLRSKALKALKIFLLIYIVLFLGIQTVNVWQKVSVKIEALRIQTVLAESGKKSDTENKPVLINEPDGILISKIGVSAPIIFVNSTNPKDFKEPLKRGVTHFPSALPGEKGRAVILGHSAPLYWPKINYDGIFSDLNDLLSGDEISVIFKGKQYKYRVTEKIFLKKGQDAPHNSIVNADVHSELLLISCWPPGIDNKRIVVVAELI